MIFETTVPEIFLAAPKMVSFSQLPAVTKDTIFGAARNFFWPFLFRDGFSYMLHTPCMLLPKDKILNPDDT
jgi:hypothetical protein